MTVVEVVDVLVVLDRGMATTRPVLVFMVGKNRVLLSCHDSKLRTETLSPKQIRMRGTLTPPRINLGDALRICLVFRTSAEPGARTGGAAERQHPHPQTGTFSDLARGNSLLWQP